MTMIKNDRISEIIDGKRVITRKPELLAPAGNLEKLKIAVHYGADAVFIGGQEFGLRSNAGNFSLEEMQEGVEFANKYGSKIYVTTNIFAHNDNMHGLEEYLQGLERVGITGIIVADPLIIETCKEVAPKLEIHLSTQQSLANWKAVQYWKEQGLERVVLARETGAEEIQLMKEKVDIEIESFVHGAMCISYSGRCLLSNYMTSRDANRGSCAHPCRWKYYLVEEKRPGEYFPIEEDESGTYIFNSKDLCLIDSIKEVIESGINSLKIEGRVKTAYYVATVVRAYRIAIDRYYEDPDGYQFDPELLEEVKKASYRDFTHGFYIDRPDHEAQNYGSSSYIRNYDFVGVVRQNSEDLTLVEIRNRTFVGDEVEIISPHLRETIYAKVHEMYNENMEAIEVAPRPKEFVWMKFGVNLEKDSFIRKKDTKENLIC